jgi:hypothetical protein
MLQVNNTWEEKGLKKPVKQGLLILPVSLTNMCNRK